MTPIHPANGSSRLTHPRTGDEQGRQRGSRSPLTDVPSQRPAKRHLFGAVTFDAVVVGSGFGGAMCAHALARAGQRVLVVERGGHVQRDATNWAADGTLELTSCYPPVARRAGMKGRASTVRAPTCVGGGSVFYGGVALRMREADFRPDPALVGESRAAWPFGYAELAPYYDETERLLDVAGKMGVDPCEPPRTRPYPQPSPPLSPVADRIARSAASLGLLPFPLPLAINYRRHGGRAACRGCSTCDTFACAIRAKNDMATVVLPGLEDLGVTVLSGVTATELSGDGGRVRTLECRDEHGLPLQIRGRRFYLAAGALGTPALLLSSGLDRHNPAGQLVGRYLSRHCSAIVMGFFPRRLDPAMRFHKQIGIHDFYDGDEARGWSAGIGSLQQISSPPVGLLERELPGPLKRIASPVRERLTGLLAMAHDQPAFANRVRLARSATRGASPEVVVEHAYSERDRRARAHLVSRAGEILRAAGAVHLHVHPIETFSHAVGTVRMGEDPLSAPVDPDGRFRGVENVHIVDGSVLPTSAAVNPSLTIAAIALRSAERSLELDGGSRVAAAA